MAKKKSMPDSALMEGYMPQHIAIIMDGNGRWAQQRLLPRTLGHRAGMSALKKVVQTCDELRVPFLTVFAFSTENWKRPETEVNYLMNLLVEFCTGIGIDCIVTMFNPCFWETTSHPPSAG